MERNEPPSERGESTLSAAAKARRRQRRTRSRNKTRSAWLSTTLENLGWIALAIVLGVPVLAGLLYLASR